MVSARNRRCSAGVAGLLAEEWIAREHDRYAFVDSLHREWVLRETR